MTTSDHDNEKQLDEYIDALNAGRSLPQLDDAELLDLVAVARDVLRLRAAEPSLDEVSVRMAAALERELRANPAHERRNLKSDDMHLLVGASPDATLPPSIHYGTTYVEPRRPQRARQWAQFAVAAVAFIVFGLVMAQIIGGGGGDEPEDAVGSDRSGSPTIQVSPTDSGASILPPDVSTATESRQEPTSTPGTTASTSTPAVSPNESSPGLVTVYTFDEVRDLARFEIVEPSTVPQHLALERITVYTAPDQTSPEAITAYYRLDGSDEVQFWQTAGGCIEPDMIEGTHEDIVIDGRAVHRSLGTNAIDEPTASYRWLSGETCYIVRATLIHGVDEDLLTSLVSRIPSPTESSTIEATPTVTTVPASATATPSISSFATLSITLDYVTCDDIVVADGSNFIPGTTVVIYGGALFGDNFGPVTDDILVADNGGFEFVLDLSRVFAQCSGATERQDGAQFMLSAETGSTMTKGGFDGPSAQAVITLSSTAPAALKDRPRLPSCGIEFVRTETEMAPRASRT